LTAEVTGTVPATLSAADGPDEAAVDVCHYRACYSHHLVWLSANNPGLNQKAHPSPPLKRKNISPCDDYPERSQSPGKDAHPDSESEDHQRPPVNDLAQRIEDLETKNLRLKERYLAISLTMEKECSRARWIGAFDRVIEKSCEHLQLEIFFWAIDYAIGDVNTVDARLSASEKQSIIAALDGYCKQEDWESLMKRFPAKIQKSILQLFAHTLWTKHLFEDVFMKPFLYFNFYEQEEMTSTAGKPDTSLPTELQNMYQMFRTGTVSHLLQSKLTDRNVSS
jgi:hypothetical protein